MKRVVQAASVWTEIDRRKAEEVTLQVIGGKPIARIE